VTRSSRSRSAGARSNNSSAARAPRRGVARTPTAAARLRASLSHPVIDADGHVIETAPVFMPFFEEYVAKIAGRDMVKRFREVGGMDFDEMVLRPWSRLSWEERRAAWATRPSWWSLPAANTLDRATSHLPRLLWRRLDDLGIDFAVLYGSRTLTTTAIKDDEVRRVACRALNAFNAEVYRPYADRMTPAAHIPMHTPEEAIAELEHAVGELGFKAIMINGLVHRPISAVDPQAAQGTAEPPLPNWGSGSGERIDCLGLDSAYDYDPFWRRCIELRVVPASHTPGMGWGSRRSVSNYMANHIGSFGASMEAQCRSLFMGGVTHRFPQLAFGLLEGGVSWACQLYADLIGHWQKRNNKSIHRLDPARIDTALVAKLFAEYGDAHFHAGVPGLMEAFTKLEPAPPFLDEWEACGVRRESDVRDKFVPSFYFGCEADDAGVALAFDARMNPLGAKLNAMFSSDLGHWDVRDMTEILGEAFELVEHERIDERAFRDFVFENPARFYTRLNPDFFAGTRVEADVAKLLGRERKAAR
jgi:predicted TIM-barrel fold metal-dependent hydrolase